MRTAKGLKAKRAGTMLVAGLILSASTAWAEFSTEKPSSILIFPKVINAGSRDTVIQITNTSNMTAYARCFYVNGALRNPAFEPGPTNRPLCTMTDFELTLTKQQPTHWAVSEGRAVDPAGDPPGLDPGGVPPVPPGFTGELICVQVDSSMGQVAANALKGEATIGATDLTDVAKYSAVGIQGLGGLADPEASDTLNLDNIEYNACPAGLQMNFAAEQSEDTTITDLGGIGAVGYAQSNLTLVPCSIDLILAQGAQTNIYLEYTNEFEQTLSRNLALDCWGSFPLEDITGLDEGDLGSAFGTARICAGGDCQNPDPDQDVGVIGVLSTRRMNAGNGSGGTANVNLHFLGNDPETNRPGAEIKIRGIF